MRYATLVLVLTSVVLAGCGNAKMVGFPFVNQYCASDGTAVFAIFPNSQGQYEPMKASPQNCPGAKK